MSEYEKVAGMGLLGLICLIIFVIAVLYCLFEWRNVLEWIRSIVIVVAVMVLFFGSVFLLLYGIGSGMKWIGIW